MSLLGGDLTTTKNQEFFAELTPDQMFSMEVFHPYALAKFLHAQQNGTKFVHYTTADTAMRIFQNQQIWLRNSTCMNDFMEIEYGLKCLESAYEKHLERINQTLGGLFPDLPNKLRHNFVDWVPAIRTQTFIASVSEHGNVHRQGEEDKIGRLSMWRAYGGSTGVAIVMNNGPFLRPTNALGAFTSPVAYLSEDEFENEFLKMLDAIALHKDKLTSLGEDVILRNLFECYRSALLCTKHPGFHEEREWRVIFSPSLHPTSRLISELQTIAGTPQQIYKLPLKNIPEENFYGVELQEFIDRVIVGPTSFPYVIRNAIVTQLSMCGLQNASDIVTVSDIPLR